MVLTGESRSIGRTVCQNSTRSTTNPTRTDLESNTRICYVTKVTNCLSHGAAQVSYVCLGSLTYVIRGQKIKWR